MVHLVDAEIVVVVVGETRDDNRGSGNGYGSAGYDGGGYRGELWKDIRFNSVSTAPPPPTFIAGFFSDLKSSD